MKTNAVLVTGGNRGVGAGIVQQFQEAGYWVAACSSHDSSRWESNPDLKLYCDVSDSEQVVKMFKTLSKIQPELYAIVNNAGTICNQSLDSQSANDDFLKTLAVNVHGVYFVTKQGLPFLKNGGRIINLSSILGLKGVPGASAYCASKHAVVGLTRSLAHDLGSKNITVNVICPGWTRSDMALGRFGEMGITEAQAISSQPLKRILEPSEIGAMAVFLASPLASGITGQTFTIDCGAIA